MIACGRYNTMVPCKMLYFKDFRVFQKEVFAKNISVLRDHVMISYIDSGNRDLMMDFQSLSK